MPTLYNKYRPQTFEDVIGQGHITLTLQNQVKNKTFSHSYLFTGTRGTGKTTCARILARALSCQSPHENGEPCNECEVCRGFLGGSLPDITEIDAASNNGVDDIRRMREEIAYSPVMAKYKVYIIDEVHMLSGSAFNALLKTLEEPPEHAVFILATTEIHKVPATIMSRCQRFDFSRIRTSEITAQLKKILALEGKVLPEQSVELVAEMGDGSMRDALSVLDKVAELKTEEEIRDVLGLIDREKIYGLLRAVAKKDTDLIFEQINEIYFSARDFTYLCTELLAQLRALLVVKNVKNYKKVLDSTERTYVTLEEIANMFTSEQILYSVTVLQQTLSSLSLSQNKRADVEICFLKLAHPETESSAAALTARIAALEEKLKNAAALPVLQPKAQEKKPAEKEAKQKQKEPLIQPAKVQPEKKAGQPIEQQKEPAPETETTATDDEYHDFLLWNDVCDRISNTNLLFGHLIKKYAVALVKQNEALIVCNDADTKKDVEKNRDLIKDSFASIKKEITSLRAVEGKKQDYLDKSKIYDNLENNELLKFE